MAGGRQGRRRDSRVVVITGASSGIGRATAEMFARQGVRLVLAARHRGNLEEVAADCAGRGAAEVLVVPTDVSVEEQVHALAHAAMASYGRIDVWVGAASVYSYGTVERTPSHVVRRILETNLLAQFFTAQALLPHFRVQGAGTLILVGSVYSKVTSPYVAPYIASKSGLLGFSEALRQEVRGIKGVKICAVLPATIDTPIYQHAANYTGRRVHPLPPVVSPYRVARAIVGLADRPRTEVVIGQTQRGFIPVHAALPGLYERCIGPVMDVLALGGGPVPPTDGAVFEPDALNNDVSGGWRAGRRRRLGLALLAPAAATVVAARRRSARRV